MPSARPTTAPGGSRSRSARRSSRRRSAAHRTCGSGRSPSRAGRRWPSRRRMLRRRPRPRDAVSEIVDRELWPAVREEYGRLRARPGLIRSGAGGDRQRSGVGGPPAGRREAAHPRRRRAAQAAPPQGAQAAPAVSAVAVPARRRPRGDSPATRPVGEDSSASAPTSRRGRGPAPAGALRAQLHLLFALLQWVMAALTLRTLPPPGSRWPRRGHVDQHAHTCAGRTPFSRGAVGDGVFPASRRPPGA